VNCAFKLFRREALADLELRADGAMLPSELMVRVVQRGLRVAEVPVAHFPRPCGAPSGGTLRVVARALAELVRLYAWLRTPRPRVAPPLSVLSGSPPPH
jgi:hypothetical protein